MSGRGVIVCVDDEQAVLNQLSTQLTRRFGATHVVECAEAAEEALRLIEETFEAGDRVEVVICDQVMPGMKGDRFLETLHAAHPEVMKVLLTGQGGLDSAIRAINHAGLDRYIEKPWEAEDLAMSVHSLLAQHRLRRDLERHHERLERRGRDLRALHDVGRDLASAADAGRVLARVIEAARSLAQTDRVAAVATLGPVGPGLWSGAPDTIVDAEARRRLTASLTATPGDLDAALPKGVAAVPLRHGERSLGYLLLPEASARDPEVGETLAILADQAAASLDNVRLLEERVASERLSAIGRMISALAHDLRNPMTAIKGYAGMFEEFDLPRHRQKDCGRLIQDECNRMSAMIDEVLDFSRGERIRLNVAPVPVEELAAHVRHIVEPAFLARRMEFRTEINCGGAVRVDMERMTRAILNIANNALEAMEAGGVFVLSAAQAGSSVRLVLDDTGRGIPEEVQTRVFEPFFTHGKASGTGLGMAIARRIVEEHGGSISLESQLGRGTRVTLTLPSSACGQD
ncbi:MAG: ATP-binding protein [Vicinamibacteria bacterium]